MFDLKKIVPSIMCANQLQLKDELDFLSKNNIDWLHIDVMDGVFVNNLAMAPYVISPIIETNKFTTDVHLACVNPEKYIEMFSAIKPDFITFHIETTNHVDELINMIHEKGIKVGIAISPNTRIESIFPYIEKIDLILVMTVNPGFAGQNFQNHVLEKLKILNQKLNDYEKKPLIQVDGNIYDKTIEKIQENGGADLYVVGTSALFYQSELTYKEKIDNLEKLIN